MDSTPQSQEILETVRKKCGQVAEPLAHVASCGAEDVRAFVFDINELSDFPTKHVRTHAEYEAVFE